MNILHKLFSYLDCLGFIGFIIATGIVMWSINMAIALIAFASALAIGIDILRRTLSRKYSEPFAIKPPLGDPLIDAGILAFAIYWMNDSGNAYPMIIAGIIMTSIDLILYGINLVVKSK